jgi:hypothetical protein
MWIQYWDYDRSGLGLKEPPQYTEVPMDRRIRERDEWVDFEDCIQEWLEEITDDYDYRNFKWEQIEVPPREWLQAKINQLLDKSAALGIKASELAGLRMKYYGD